MSDEKADLIKKISSGLCDRWPLVRGCAFWPNGRDWADPMTRVGIVVVLLGVAPLGVGAQAVAGIVSERETGEPVMGAMVVLFDDEGDRVDRFLTNAAGRFVLRARHVGAHYITVDRIGYASMTTDRFEPRGDAELMRIEVPVEPVVLSALEVAGAPRCEVRPEEGQISARVWEEARKALVAEAWTREVARYRYTLLRYQRTLDPYGRAIVSETEETASDLDAPFASIPLESLANVGFVQPMPDSTTRYYAPDAEAILSDFFLDTHCLAATRDEEGRIGLIFRPVPGRSVPEIRGVLWLDSETAELEQLLFDYLNLRSVVERGWAGGEIGFTRLPGGEWIVGEWLVRTPILEVRSRNRVRRTGYLDTGGITTRVTDSQGRVVLDSEAASIWGVVTDSVGAGPPVEAVDVELLETGERVRPGDDGSFLFNNLDAGQHRLRVLHPLIRNWSVAAPVGLSVHTKVGEVAYARLRLPTVSEALAAVCGGPSSTGGTAVLLGQVMSAGGSRLGRTEVMVRWPTATGYLPPAIAVPPGPEGEPGSDWRLGRDGHFTTATARTDARGLFMLCDVSWGTRLQIAVRGEPGGVSNASATFLVRLGEDVVRQSIVVPGVSDPPAPLPSSRR